MKFLSANDLIENAIDRGVSRGLESLDGVERLVFLISEAEVCCDKDGIDAFVDKYGLAGISELANAYATIGATELAAALLAVVQSAPNVRDRLLDLANEYVTRRQGYEYEAIERVVAPLLGIGS